MGISKNGSENDKHRQPEGELPLRQETKERIIEIKSNIKKGIIIKWSLIIPGPKLSGGYFTKLIKFSLGQ